jgi:hypothetical protein
MTAALKGVRHGLTAQFGISDDQGVSAQMQNGRPKSALVRIADSSRASREVGNNVPVSESECCSFHRLVGGGEEGFLWCRCRRRSISLA